MANSYSKYWGIDWPNPDDEQQPYTPVPIQQQQKAKAPAGVQGRFQQPVTPTVPTPPVYQQDRWESAPREVYPQDRWEAAPQAQPPMRDRWESAPTPPQRPYLPMVTQDGTRSEAMPPLVASAPPVGGLPIVTAASRILPQLWDQRDEWVDAVRDIVSGANAAPQARPAGRVTTTDPNAPSQMGQLFSKLMSNPFVDFNKLSEAQRGTNFGEDVREWVEQGKTAPLNLAFYPAMRLFETTGERPFTAIWTERNAPEEENAFPQERARLADLDRRLASTTDPNTIAGLRAERISVARDLARKQSGLRTERVLERGLFNVTPEEQAAYRRDAPMSLQLLTGLLYDPLNAFDLLGPVRDASRVSRAAKELAPAYPTVKTAGGVLRPATSAEAKAATVAKLSKYNTVNQRLGPLAAFIPWRHTPQTMGEQLVNRTINATNRMLDGLPKTADGGIDLNLLQKAVADPHAPDIVAATAGYSQSAEWLDTAVVIDRALGVTPEATDAVATAQRAKIQQVEEQITATQKAIAETTAQLDNLKAQGKPAQQVNRTTNRLTKQQNSLANQQKHLDNLKAQVQQPGRVDFAGLIKLAQQPDSDTLTIAAELARQYADAAESFFPTTGKGLGRQLVNARDRFNNSILSTALLGTNPGYAFRNAANNLVTALVDGVNPYQSAEDLRALWVRWGAPPVQTKQGIGPGDAFKNRATTAEYLQNLATPLRMRDTFKLNGRKLTDFTRAWAANWEAYASERIVAHHIQTYFPQTWGGYLKELRKQIVQAGQLDETQATQITRLWASKLNRTELHEAIDAMTGPSRPRVTPPTAPTTPPAAPPAPGTAPTPPTAPSAPGWGTRPGAKKPYGTEPAPAPVLDLARTLSEDEAAQLVAEAGPGADTLARELLQAGPAAQRVFVDVLVPAQERSAQLAAHVNTLAGQTYTPGQRASLQQFLEDVQGVIETAKDNDDAMRQGVFEAAQNVTEAERTLIFREWRRARDTARRELYRRLDALEEARMPELGFDEQAVTNSRTHRQFIADAWARSDRVIENYWTGKGKGISQDYEAVNKERRRIWTDVQNRIKLRAEQWDADLDRAIASGKGKAATAAPAPTAPPTPEQPPAATPFGAEPEAPAPTAAQPARVQPDAGQISRISAKARELGIPSASDRNVGTGAQGAMWDQHALNIARQRFPGEIRPDSKAFRSLQKATPDELNLVEQALDERLAERAAPRVDVPPAAGPEVAPAQQPITPAPAVAAGPQTVAPAPQEVVRTAPSGARELAQPDKFYINTRDEGFILVPEAKPVDFSDVHPGEFFIAHPRPNITREWEKNFWVVSESQTGMSITNPLKTKREAIESARKTLRRVSEMGPQSVDALEENVRRYGLSPRWRAVGEAVDTPITPTTPDPRRPWETPSIRIERARRGTRLPVPGQPSTRVPFGKEPSAPSVGPTSRYAGKQPWELTQVQVQKQDAVAIFPHDAKVEIRNGKPVYIHSTTVKWDDGTRTFEFTSRGQPSDAILRLHKQVVQQALAEGKNVPANVLADYPDLARQAQPRAAYAPPAVTREAEFMGPYAPPAIVGDYEARALPPSVFETWDDLVLGYDRAPYAPPAMTERPLQPGDWQRYGVPERMSIALTPPQVTPPVDVLPSQADYAAALRAQAANLHLTERQVDDLIIDYGRASGEDKAYLANEIGAQAGVAAQGVPIPAGWQEIESSAPRDRFLEYGANNVAVDAQGRYFVNPEQEWWVRERLYSGGWNMEPAGTRASVEQRAAQIEQLRAQATPNQRQRDDLARQIDSMEALYGSWQRNMPSMTDKAHTQLANEIAQAKARLAAMDAPQVTPPSVAAPGKQPWEMTRAEFVAQQRAEFTPRKGGRYDKGDVWDNFHESQAKDLHNLKVVDALRSGQPVSPQVLADYPDLQRAARGAGAPNAARITELEQRNKTIFSLTNNSTLPRYDKDKLLAEYERNIDELNRLRNQSAAPAAAPQPSVMPPSAASGPSAAGRAAPKAAKPELVGYEWRTTKGEKWSNYEGGIVGAKVSDWDRSLKSERSGRDIVHIYWIRGTDGQIRPYGKVSALNELGYDTTQLDRKANKFVQEAMAKKAADEGALDEFTRAKKYASAEEARKEFKVNTVNSSRNWGWGTPQQHLDEALKQVREATTYEKDGKYITVYTGGTKDKGAQLAEWQRIDPAPAAAPPSVTPPTGAGAPAAPISLTEITEEAGRQTTDRIRTADIAFDPDRFQYKLDTDAQTGVTRQFANVKTWNPALGRGISVWVDPADGKTYVVNGHHRLEMAQRLKAEYIEAPYYIQAATAEEARLIGALQNVAEGRGTAIDAAKLFKDAAFDMAQLDRWGLALSESTVRDGLALANLNDTIFATVVRKEIPVERAVIIGARLPDHDMQMQLIRALDQQMQRGRKITNDVVAELADAMTGGPTGTVTQNTLFGEEVLTQSYAFEKAEFYAYVRGRLAKEKRLFTVAAQNATELQRAGQIDAAVAGSISDDAARLLELFDTLKNQRGIISDIGNQAAEALAKGGNANALKDDYYKRLTDAIPDAIRRSGPDATTAGNTARFGTGGLAGEQSSFFPSETPRQTGPGLFDVGIVAPGTQEAFAVMDAATAAARRVADFFTNRRVAAQPVNPLTPEQAAWLHKFADDFAAPKQMKAKAIASNIAVKMRNFALGDYADRRNIHEWLTWLYPYAYWYTFTYPNWARRIMQHPAILSNYARYKQAVREQNREYYRDMMGDPNAEPPEYWNYQLRIPLGDTSLYFNLERNLNPLVQLVESFKQTAKSAAPAFPWNAQTPEGERGFFQSGDFIQALGDFGPSISPPLIYAYALWLAAQGYTEAAQQWVGGYLTPVSRLMRPVTAAIREKIPATGAVIPPGGWSPEMLILDFMQRGGDYWQQRSGIPAALVDLYRTNKATATEVENAAWSRDVWDSKWGDAAQANALKTLAPVFASWLLGQGFKPTDITDVQIQQMWDDKAALTAQKGTLSKEDYNAAWEAFKDKYPWFNVFMLARSQDPVERLDAFTDLVLDRLPPAGPQRQQMLTDAGMPQALMDRYYSDKYSTANFTPEERAQFELAIEKLAGTVDVPDAATQATYDAARSENQAINAAAAAAAGVALALVQATEQQYYDIKDAQGEAAAKAFLAQHPELEKYWDEKKLRRAQGSDTYREFYGKPTDRGLTEALQQFGETEVRFAQAYLDMTPEQRTAWNKANPGVYRDRIAPVLDVMLKYNEKKAGSGTGSAGAQRAALYDKGRAEAVQQYGEAGVREAEAYNDLDDAQSTAFRQANPEAYARIKAVNRTLFKYLPSNYSSSYTPRTYSGGSSYSGGRSYSGRSYGSAPAAPVAPVTVTPQQPAAPEWQNWQESDFNARWQPLVDADPALPQLVNVLFGRDMLNVMRMWLKLSPEQRALWLQNNPQLWAMLQRFMRWLLGQQVGQTGAGALLGSIPPNAPVPSAGTVPPNAPYVPTPPALPVNPPPAPAGVPLPP